MAKNAYIRPRSEAYRVERSTLQNISKVKGYAFDNYESKPELVISFEEDQTGDDEFLDLD